MNIKVTLFYFSGTGNTWWVAKKIAEKLNDQNIATTIRSIESDKVSNQESIKEIITKSDIIGFGYPIYGSDIPDNFMAFINNLPKVEGKKAFIFTTMMLFSGDGAMVAARKLRKKGFKVKQAVNIQMFNNVRLPYIFLRNFKVRNGEETIPIKKKAEKKIEKLVTKIINEKKWLQGRDPFNISVGLMQRIPVRMIGFSFFAKYYFVNMETCTECMQCVEYCPMNNISYEDGEFTFGKKCIACTRCYNFCPEDAIQHKKGTFDRKRYPRYKGPGDNFKVNALKK